MNTQLTPEETAAIEREAEEKYPYPDVCNDMIAYKVARDIINKRREEYVSAVKPYALLLKQERERANVLLQHIIDDMNWQLNDGIMEHDDSRNQKTLSVINKYNNGK